MTVASELLEELAPWMTGDLAQYLEAIGSMWEQIEQFTLDDPNDDGSGAWTILLDVDRCPTDGLPYLAQWNGERIQPGMTDAQARAEITNGPNNVRGTPQGIARAAQRTLTGTGSVQILERELPTGEPDPNGDYFTVITWTNETPYPDQVWQDLLSTIPADMVCNYETEVGATWQNIKDSYATWGDVKAAFATWADVLGYRTGANVWRIPT